MKVQIDYEDLQRQRGRRQLKNARLLLKYLAITIVWGVLLYNNVSVGEAGIGHPSDMFFPILIAGPVLLIAVVVKDVMNQTGERASSPLKLTRREPQ